MKSALVFVLLLIVACGGPKSAPEEEIREWLASAQSHVEAKQRSALIDMISPAYTDARGQERSDIDAKLRIYFLRQNNIELVTKIDEIRIYGDSAAEVEMTVGMAGTNDGVFGFSADAYAFELELERSGDEWRLIAARWGELGQDLR